MPVYDFECKECSNISEDYLSSSGSQNPICNKCGNATKRLLSSFAIDMDGIVTSSPSGRAELHSKGARIV